jgi:spore maturation protein SpmA
MPVPVVDGSVEGVLITLFGIGSTWLGWMLLANRNGRGTRFTEFMTPFPIFKIDTYRKTSGWISLIMGVSCVIGGIAHL